MDFADQLIGQVKCVEHLAILLADLEKYCAL